jgi:hypothetical protein
MSLEDVNRIKSFIGDLVRDLDPQDAANVLGEVASDIDATLDSLKEDYDVEPE